MVRGEGRMSGKFGFEMEGVGKVGGKEVSEVEWR